MQFLHHVHHMRGVAIVPVVAVHCISMFDWPAGSIVGYVAPLFINVNIMFIFVSGYLFGHMADDLEPLQLPRSAGSEQHRRPLRAGVGARDPRLPDAPQGAPAPAAGGPPTAPAAILTVFFLVTGAHLGPLWLIPGDGDLLPALLPRSCAWPSGPAMFLALPFLLLLSRVRPAAPPTTSARCISPSTSRRSTCSGCCSPGHAETVERGAEKDPRAGALFVARARLPRRRSRCRRAGSPSRTWRSRR